MAAASASFCTITSDRVLAELWRKAIQPLGSSHLAFDSLVTAMRRLADENPSVLLADISEFGLSPNQIAVKIRRRCPLADVLTVVGDAGHRKPDDLERWGIVAIPRECEPEQLQARLGSILHERVQVQRCGWIGLTPEIRAASSLLLAAASSDATVLIEGESGTGKELAARAVHHNSARASRPFLALNCSAFPETLLESELFGHEKGAFTDAFARKKGIFEAVEGGTIFLDEIGETFPAVQARLLRVLEERQVRPIGATKTLPVDFRIVAATNRNLHMAVADSSFRRDLYFRLAVIQLTLPPLRGRRGDIPALIQHHLAPTNWQGRLAALLAEDALARLVDYDWPGNIRELRNFIERARVRFPDHVLDHDMAGSLLETVRPAINLPVVTGRRADNVEREMIFAALSELKHDLEYLKRRVDHLSGVELTQPGSSATPAERFASMREVERDRIALALRQSRGNRAQAAQMLGMGERTLYRKLREYGL